MKILITGGAGFIGNRVVRKALERGHSVVNVDALTYAASISSVWELEDAPGYSLHALDICDRTALEHIFSKERPDAVMHLAAESHVDRSIEDPSACVSTNITGTFTLLEAARAYWHESDQPTDFRFHHISTDEVYGTLGRAGRFTEDTRYAPNSPYSASKAASDHLVRAWHQTYGLPVLTSHGCNTYGPWQYPEKLIPMTLLRALAGEAIPIYGKGTQSREWLHVDDHAAALLDIVEGGTPGEVYNIAGEPEVRNVDLVRALCRLLQLRKPAPLPYSRLICHVEDRPGHDFRYATDDTKLREALGWHPKIALEAGLADTIDWYLSHNSWWQPLAKNATARRGLVHQSGQVAA